MKKLLFLFCLFNCTMAAAQRIPDYGINRIRLSEADRTLWFETLPTGGSLKPVIKKTYFWYGAGRIQNTQGGYSGRLLNGFYRAYFLNKNLMEEGLFNNGLRNSLWKKWNESGALTETTSWKNGERDGPFQVFNESGQVSTSGTYKKGLLDGPVKQYIDKDSVSITYYKRGVISQPLPFLKRINPFHRERTEKKPQ